MDQSRFEQIEALVDTGAIYTVVPSDVLERLGITPQFRRRFRVADGRVVELDMAFVSTKIFAV
ncbi:aspartyl protease family protein [Fervidibacter sacchari]